ncbi:MAG: arginine--tRNA ligase, partial [Phascolarctobacterium sp.]|nr:arginine--tRNA ligase [Phascolarctobacterium sp.]
TVEFPENGYHGYDIIETAERIVRIYGDKFLNMSEEERLQEFRTIALKEKLAALKEDLEAFNVTYDEWFSEQTLHDAKAIHSACDLLTERGYLYEQDGALWLKATEYGDDKDRVVIRDNGVPTYFAADIAYHQDKYARGFDRVINLWGADHHGYIARMKAAVGALGYHPDQLEVLILQMVSLYRNGELVKMSKRTGQSVTLNELIEEVGTDAARFFFVMRSIDSQLDFDLTLATEKSNENPVYYIQYAHARICSIMRQLEEAGIVVMPAAEAKLNTMTEASELELIKKLGEYHEMLAGAAKERAVHRVAHYVHDLAGLFHSFYNQCRILGVDSDLQQARIALVKTVGHVIRHALGILGVSAPERM